jgi:hypothetical protein
MRKVESASLTRASFDVCADTAVKGVSSGSGASIATELLLVRVLRQKGFTPIIRL